MAQYQPRNHRMTIYDLMEAKGVFAQNKNNPEAINDQGESIYERAEYPKMFYHPKGELREINPGEVILRLGKQERVGQQFEMISSLATSEEEEERMREEGWHDHPADAMAAAGLTPPSKSSDQRIKQLEAEVERLRALQGESGRKKTAGSASSPAP